MGLRVRRFSVFCGVFRCRLRGPQLRFRAWLVTDYEAVPAVDADADAPQLGTVVMKFGGTSVGDPEKLKRVAARLVAAREEGHRVVGVLSAMGHTTDELLDLAHQISPHAASARARHARLGRRADLVRPRRDGDPRPRPRGDLADRLAGGDRHRHGARQGQDRRGARASDPRGARRGDDRPRRRLPGRLDRVRGDDARPRRLGHDRGRARGRARRRPLRDLHRRARRLLGRPASRPGRPPAHAPQLRRDARDGVLGRRRAGNPLDRGRAQPQCEAPRPLDVRGGRRHVDPGGGRGDAREGTHLRRRAPARGDRVPRRRRQAGAALRRARARRP